MHEGVSLEVVASGMRTENDVEVGWFDVRLGPLAKGASASNLHELIDLKSLIDPHLGDGALNARVIGGGGS
ncbi:hypothetical protein BjapCC829_34670 [Bradyrhizobium barranii]|uniref:Uncharacterized protein n=1 Tax=Bradyrhizobium barranii TaxID=2992140 RepID=A0ABY3QGC7_9BRAD|nr:hypothetical protein [Bradyrhizobium japonicum]UFW85030.1 hypothetical protein BjapCC829_34670 [Bradyrhizobium japonicum]